MRINEDNYDGVVSPIYFEKLLGNNPYGQTKMLVQDYLAELELDATIDQ